MPDVITAWTGCLADCLRQALRMTSEDFAEHLGVAVRTVAYWRSRPGMVPQPGMQEVLDAALAQAPERARALFWELQAGCASGGAARRGVVTRLLESEDAASLTEWLTGTSVSDEAISSLDRAATRLAEAHGQAAPVLVLAEARQVQASVQAMLRGGPRHRQARELLRIDGALLAHIGLLLSDLGDDAAGDDYASAALAYLREAGASEDAAWYVQAKIARWRHQYSRSAELAAQGLERSSPGPMRVQLACYEAHAAALLGDPARARAAMNRAEDAAAALPPGDMTLSPWSFPAERMAVFRLGVALGTGDADGALAVAAASDAGLAPARPRNSAALAQLRVGAAIAHLAKDDLDSAAGQAALVLALPPEFRIASVTGRLAELASRLAAPRYARSPLATGLAQHIRDFTPTTPAPKPAEGEQR